jgi:hypothetical protein
MKITIQGLEKGIANMQSIQKMIDAKCEAITTLATQEIASEAKLNLQGRVLGIVSSNLITDTYGLTTQKTAKGYENQVVSSAVSKTGGFHYGVYWELEGGRPFLNPAVQASIQKITNLSVLKLYEGMLQVKP